MGFREQGKARLALGSLLRPQAKPPVPLDPLCPQGLLYPPGRALHHLGAPPHSGGPSTLCFAPPSRTLSSGTTFTPPGGPSAHWTGPSNLQGTLCPAVSCGGGGGGDRAGLTGEGHSGCGGAGKLSGPREPAGDPGMILCTLKQEALQRPPWVGGARATPYSDLRPFLETCVLNQ